MDKSYLTEAFKSLQILEEEDFNLADSEDVEKMKDFVDSDEKTELIDIIDPEADNEEELQDNYIGKVICDCEVCHSKIYKEPTEIIIDEEKQLANIGEECPYCYSADGFKIVGQVAPFNPDEEEPEKDADVDGVDVEDELEKEEKTEKEEKNESLTESIYDKGLSKDKQNVLEFPNGEYFYVDVKDGKIFAGGATNNGIIREFEIDYDEDCDLDCNLEKLYNHMLEQKPELLGESLTEDTIKKDGKWVNKGKEGTHGKFATKKAADKQRKAMFANGFKGEALGEEKCPECGKEIDKDHPMCDKCKDKLELHNNRKGAFLHGEDDPGFDEFDIKKEDLSESENLTEKKWDKEIKSGAALRKAINDEDYQAVVDGMVKVYEEAISLLNEDDAADFETALEDLKFALYNNGESGELDFENHEDIGEDIDYYLNELYDLCDAYNLWVAVDDSDIDESLVEGKREDIKDESLTESVEEVEVKADGQKVEVKPDEDGKLKIEIEKCEDCKEGEEIVPLEPEMKNEIEANSDEQQKPEEDEIDYDVDDFDEESFDRIGESYLKKVYENVNSFKTTKVSKDGNKLKLEGLINFKSGKDKKTSFVFEAKTADRKGKVKFLGENLQISRGKKSFTLKGNMSDKKFVTESLTYNYMAKDSENKSVRLYGTIK